MTDASTPLKKLLRAKATQPNWRKVCEHLDALSGEPLAEALAAVEAESARWAVDTQKRDGWELPARYTPQPWARRLLAGDAPPAFPAVRFFQLHSAKVTDAGLARILSTGALGAITHLYLGSCSLNGAALALLTQHAEQLGALTHLVLTDNALEAGGLRGLLATPLGARLQMLDVYQTPLDRRDVLALRETPMPALRSLSLGFIDATGEELAEILTAQTLPGVTRLTVAARDAYALAETLRARGVGQPHLCAALRSPW